MMYPFKNQIWTWLQTEFNVSEDRNRPKVTLSELSRNRQRNLTEEMHRVARDREMREAFGGANRGF